MEIDLVSNFEIVILRNYIVLLERVVRWYSTYELVRVV